MAVVRWIRFGIGGGPWRGAMALLALLLLLSGCGITRSDGGFFCPEPCSDPDRVRDFFCDCIPRSDEDDDGILRAVVKLTRGRCIPSGQEVYFFNNTGSDVEAEVVKRITEGTDSEYLRHWIFLDRGEEQRVGCDVPGGPQQISITVGRIRRLRSADLMSPRFHDGGPGSVGVPQPAVTRRAHARVTLARWRPARASVALAVDSAPASCRTICGTEPDLCTAADLPPEIAAGLRGLRFELLVPGRSRLAMSTLHELFGIPADEVPCERTPVRLENGRLESSGEECVVSTGLDPRTAGSGPATVVAEISVPGELEARWSFVPLAADFSTSLLRPSISIRDRDSVLFKGEVAGIEATKHHLFVDVVEPGAGRTCWDLILDNQLPGRMNHENALSSLRRHRSADSAGVSVARPDRGDLRGLGTGRHPR